ncbi:MAG TPA: hypothetical protein VIX84_10330 [Acidimicrobiales bacterium]
MDVVMTRAARDYVRDHGGLVHVDSHTHRCCTGRLTLPDASEFTPIDAGDGVEVYFRDGPDGRPD